MSRYRLVNAVTGEPLPGLPMGSLVNASLKAMDRRRNARRRQLSGAHTAESWNVAHPIGTPVRYWPIYPPSEGFPPKDTTTRSEAWTLGDGSVVVLVSGKTGGVHLSHVEVLP